MSAATPQAEQDRIDRANAAFWDELCGTPLAREVGIADASPQSLARYDDAYFSYYPYLDGYLPGADQAGQRALEIGLGYGTVGHALAARGLDYRGLDIAEGPVAMMRHRLGQLGIEDADERVAVGSVLEIPHPADSFEQVVALGCLHHTGDIPAAVSEIHRVLGPGGRALVMLYNRRSLRRLVLAVDHLLGRGGRGRSYEERVRWTYDHSTAGEAAPETEFTSIGQARRIFSGFASVRIRRENFDGITRGPLNVRRERLLGVPARLAGLDLYVTAHK